MRKLMLIYLLIIAISLFSNHNPVEPVESLIDSSIPVALISVNSMNITLYYNVWENYGIITYTVFLTDIEEENYTSINIPLISDNTTYIAVYDDNGKPLIFNYYEFNGEKWIEVLVANITDVIVTYGLENFFGEVSIGTYIALINLTTLMNYTFTLVMQIDGIFETIVEPSPNTVRVVGETTEIIFTEPNEYIVTLLTLYTPPSPATTTPTITPTTTPTTTPQTTPTNTTVVNGKVAETVEKGRRGIAGLVIIGILILIAVVAFIVVRRK